MIDVRYKPMHLPQVSAPFTYVLDKLEDEGIEYNVKKVSPDELKPSQGIVALDKISEIKPDKIKPIWVGMNNEILDGHHRYGAALSHGLPSIRCVQIMLNPKDAIRVLNKIQDIHEHEKQLGIEEVVGQNSFNARNEPNPELNQMDFLEALEKEMDGDKEILHDEKVFNSKKRKVTGWRKNEMVENSKVGNFFFPKAIDGAIEYTIEFDNLLDTDDMNVIYQKGDNPVFILAKKWFPHIDFEKICKKYELTPDAVMNRAVAEKARKMGYDGIRYGDIMIQGL